MYYCHLNQYTFFVVTFQEGELVNVSASERRLPIDEVISLANLFCFAVNIVDN